MHGGDAASDYHGQARSDGNIALLSEGGKHSCFWKLQFIIDADNMVGQARVNFSK